MNEHKSQQDDSPQSAPKENNTQSYTPMPVNSYAGASIVVLVALVIFLVFSSFSSESNSPQQAHIQGEGNKEFLLPTGFFPTKDEVARGTGDIILIEYSDYECPFCKRFHATAQALVDVGEVAWVYRHFPLPIHHTAKVGSVVGECVLSHAGGDAFWSYNDTVFELQPGLNEGVYFELAKQEGLDEEQLRACVSDSENSPQAQLVAMHEKDAQRLNFTGTPSSILLNPKTQEYRLVIGAQPLERVQQLLKEIK